MKSPAELQKMSAAVAMLQAMMKSNPNQPPTATKLDVKGENQTLMLTLHVPEEELKKGIATQKAAIASAVIGRLPANVAATIGTGLGAASPFQASRAASTAETKVTTNQQGDTVVVMLPGKK